MSQNSFFELFTGPMYGSKTTNFIGRINYYKYKGKSILVLKPKLDIRYGFDYIKTHDGAKLECKIVENIEDIDKIIKNNTYDSIAIDEAFMIKNISSYLIDLYFRKNYNIIISSIQLDYKGKSFEEIKNIMPYCTKISVCNAVCEVCKDDAFFSYRKSDEKEKIIIGEKDLYEARCKKHFMQ